MRGSLAMKSVATLLALLMVTLSFQEGCATLISGTSQGVAIESEPTKASVRVETTGGLEVISGETPLSVSLKRKDEYVAIVKMPGYKEKRIEITHKFNPVSVLSVLAGVLGVFVDLASGAAWNLDPQRIFITMESAALYNGGSRPEIVVTVEYEDGSTKVIRKALEPEVP